MIKKEKLCQDTTPKIEEELKRIERDYSAFCDNSLVSRFGNGESSILLSHLEFQEIYKQVTAASKATNGIFDPYFSGKYNLLAMSKDGLSKNVIKTF